MGRGKLRIYLGAAPGVGKTYAMLSEGRRRADRGTDTLIGFVECHGRSRTEAMMEGLPLVSRRTLTHRGLEFTEMDVDAILARGPALALVDELAHTNVPGSRNAKRWEDVNELLAAGIDVVTTVNIQHLESVNDVVATITGVPQRETIPDVVVRGADQVELVDMAPEALRRRMAHGNIFRADRIDAALSNYFRVGNLTALRELALLWVADKVEEQLDRYRADHGITGTWEARERVVVALTGGVEGEALIRRAARIAARAKGAELLAVHVSRSDGLTGTDPVALARQRELVESLDGTFHQVIGDNVPQALLDFARAENATQLVLGASRRGRFARMLSPGIGAATTARSGAIDVHMVTHSEVGRGWRLPGIGHGLPPRRQILGAGLAVVLLAVLTPLLALDRGTLNLTSDMLIFLLLVVTVALVGGIWPALATAVASSLLLNYYFTPPVHQWSIAELNNALALGAFVAVAVIVSRMVDLATRRTGQAARARAEAETLSLLAGTVLRGGDALAALLERLRETFGMTSVTLLERDGEAWRVGACVGDGPCARPEDADVELPVGTNRALALRGRALPASDRRILVAFAVQAAALLEQRRLAEAAAEAEPLAAADRVRTALLTAVSHDLRTPLAAAKAAVTSLRGDDVEWSPDERAELLATADESLDRLATLVDNLLDMSRLQAGALSVFARPVSADEVVPLALDALGPVGRKVGLRMPEDLPFLLADPGLLERVIANLVANAVRFSPSGDPPLVTASALGDLVEIRVIDHGPGIDRDDRERVFAPFQRLGDRDNSTGSGVGLALSRGLTEAMGGRLTPEETPGGGLTMVVSLPAA